jgi:hypothetical protein
MRTGYLCCWVHTVLLEVPHWHCLLHCSQWAIFTCELRVVTVQLIGTPLRQTFHGFIETRKSIKIFAGIRHWTTTWASLSHSTHTHWLRYAKIYSLHVLAHFPRILLTRFQDKILESFRISPTRSTYPTLLTPFIDDNHTNNETSRYFAFRQPPVTLSLLCPSTLSNLYIHSFSFFRNFTV